MVNRATWIKNKRREAEERYDTLWAPLYDEKWGVYENATHERFIHKFLSLLPSKSTILDAACGTGRYFPFVLEAGHTILGIDQSQAMLSRASEKFPAVQLQKLGLQEIHYEELFEGAICMDAMEFVFPEDWPRVLGNFRRALKQQGFLYFTVEIAAEDEIEQAYRRGQELGFPIVFGEWADEEGYHYYPSMQQVKRWLRAASLALIEEAEGDGYHHFIVRKAPANETGREQG